MNVSKEKSNVVQTMNRIFEILMKDLSQKSKNEIENQKKIIELQHKIKFLQENEKKMKYQLEQYEKKLEKFDSENRQFIKNIKSVPYKSSSFRSSGENIFA